MTVATSLYLTDRARHQNARRAVFIAGLLLGWAIAQASLVVAYRLADACFTISPAPAPAVSRPVLPGT